MMTGVMMSPMMIIMIPSSLSLPSSSSSNINAASRHSASKEHVENLLSCHISLETMGWIIILVESMMMMMTPTASDWFFITIEIVLTFFLGI